MWAAKSLSEISHVQPLWSCPSVELAISSHSGLVLPQPKPGSQVYLGLGLVQSGELKDVFFFFFLFFFSNSNWWDLNLRSIWDATSGNRNTGPRARQTPKARPSTHRSIHYGPPLWCGHPKPNCILVTLPSPGSQFYLDLGIPSGEKRCFFFFFSFLFFPPMVTGGT